MLAHHLLSTLLLLAPSPAPDPIDAPPEAVTEDDADPDALVEPEEPLDPTLAAALAKLSPEDAQALLAMDQSQLEALGDEIDRKEPLSRQEQAITDALQAAMIESFEQQLSFESGDVDVGNGLATLHLGEDFRFLGPADADRVLVEAWGNPPGSRPLGMIVPVHTSVLAPEGSWGVVITYNADGHVEDDDAEDLDYDELLEQMQAATEEGNPERVAAGYPRVRFVGWAEAPRYDQHGRRLYWAKELSFDGSSPHTLNYAIRVLGRRGVLELNAVTTMDQLGAIKPEMEKVLSRVEFTGGNRYEDFDPKLDQVAAYGIGGLIAGKVLAKAGIFAVLLKLLVAGKKILVVGGIALFVLFKRVVGRRREE